MSANTNDVASESPVIKRNAELINTPEKRQEMLARFAPIFCFHPAEKYFPMDPEHYVKNVIEVKHAEYMSIIAKHAQNPNLRDLTPEEAAELAVIEKYFWKKHDNNGDGEFNEDYAKDIKSQSEIDVPRMMMEKFPNFLVFDENAYGYKVGEKIKLNGVHPDSSEAPAPISASIIPTEEGFFIRYECFYALNDAIPGLEKHKLGFHYGDSEGVGIYVNVNEDGTFSIKSLQTFGHGRDAAQEVPLAECSTDADHRLKVFVGLNGHPSYAKQFAGRSSFLDLVGDATEIDTSKAKINDITAGTDPAPAAVTIFKKLGDSNSLFFDTTCNPQNAQQVKAESKEWHRYDPSKSFWNLLWHKKTRKQALGKIGGLIFGVLLKLFPKFPGVDQRHLVAGSHQASAPPTVSTQGTKPSAKAPEPTPKKHTPAPQRNTMLYSTHKRPTNKQDDKDKHTPRNRNSI